MRIIIEDFKDAAFTYEGTRHQVEKAKIINNIAVIKTNHKTFSWTESELKNFYDEVAFVASETGVVVSESKVLNAEIIQANSLSNRIVTKLEVMFDELSNSPTEESYKKAKSMVDTSNAMMNVMAQNYKYLTLNK
jgi:hypothetical protein